jgi:hypothetical protein
VKEARLRRTVTALISATGWIGVGRGAGPMREEEVVAQSEMSDGNPTVKRSATD